MNFTRISVEEAVELIRNNPETAQIVDIRDDQSFETKHIDSAVHLHNSNLPEFLDQADLEAPRREAQLLRRPRWLEFGGGETDGRSRESTLPERSG